MAESISGRVRLPKGFDSQTESVVEGTLTIQQGALTFPDGTSFTSSIDTTLFVTTSSFNSFTATYNTGSFTGSFKGDGSQLIGITATVNTSSLVTTSSFNSFTASINSFTASYNTGSFSGSFIGTSSWAVNARTASFAPNYVLTSVTSSMAVLSSSYSSNSEQIQGVGLASIAQVDQQNTFTQTNTFQESTYYEAAIYKTAHRAISPVLCANATTTDIFNIYDYIPYSELDETRNCTAVFIYSIEDLATGKTVRGGQALMVWSPTHDNFSTIVDTAGIVVGGSVSLQIEDDYTFGSEYVKLTATNNIGNEVNIRGLLTIT